MEHNSKIYLTQSVSVWMGLIWLRLENGSGLLWTCWWSF